MAKKKQNQDTYDQQDDELDDVSALDLDLLTENRHSVRLSDESDYFNQD